MGHEEIQGRADCPNRLQLAPLLYQRPGNLSMMEWAELDLDAALCVIPSMKMKRTNQEKEQGDAHTVPMPPQAVGLLLAARSRPH